MNEQFLHFIWKHRLFCEDKMILPSGDVVAIIDSGQHNTNAGPDFINARINFDCVTWAGNIEIHKNASDWNKHNHDKDKSYDNVILHLVLNNDCITKRTNGEEIPTLILEYDKQLEQNYQQLLANTLWIPCEKKIDSIDHFSTMQWFTNLAVERIQRKTHYFSALLEINNNNWEETFYEALARSFGMNVNNLPFEMLTKATPLNILAKHRDNIFQLEALLFGQAGFLDGTKGDEYYLLLKKEYAFLKNKYSLTAIDNHLWKFLRLRPFNFPTLRIAQLAMMIHRNEFLFSGLVESLSSQNIEKILSVKASDYWDTHYTFNKSQKKSVPKHFAETAQHNVVINTIIPFLFVYANKKDSIELKNKALELLENIDPEQNAIIRQFKSIGITSKNAFDTQALLEMKNEYCSKKRCLECSIGKKIIIQAELHK